jgi:hypothetical protein
MDDALLFQQIMTNYGGRPGKPSRKLLAFLCKKGLSEEAVDYISAYVLKKASGVSAIDFYSESGWLGANADDSVPIAIRDGLLIVGSCPNGDPVAVDVREVLGAAGYIGHETMWQEANVRKAFIVLAPALGELAQGLRDKSMPLDYYEAVARRQVR